MTPKLSLVTGKVGRDESFKRLVTSVMTHTTVAWELVVADASTEPYVSPRPEIRVIHESPRQTHTKGYNSAFRECRGEFVLWLNDDAEVCPRYDREAIRFMEDHPQVGLGALHYSENGGEFHWNSAWGCGYANFGILRKSLGDRVDWFDEEIAMYGADNSLAIRILMADCGIADIPAARVLHHSADDAVRIANQETRMRDNKRLTQKYMPHRNVWQRAYQRYKCESEPPWSHGVNPRLAVAR